MNVSPDLTTETTHIYDNIFQFVSQPIVFIIVCGIVIVYFFMFLTLGNKESSENTGMFGSFSNDDGSSSSSSGMGHILMLVAIGVFVVLLIINGINYVYNYNLFASIKNIFYGEGVPEIDIHAIEKIKDNLQEKAEGQEEDNLNPQPNLLNDIMLKKQVFNIPGNYYGYNDAKTLCKAYGSRLATYSEIEDAYQVGGEWCNYGWSEGQMALVPTQKQTYHGLQKIPGHEHDCGRPGINGGYIANPSVQFGVNCYGYKPRITHEEQEIMANSSPYPKTEKDIAMEQRVDYWKNRLDEIVVSPFNHDTWSRI